MRVAVVPGLGASVREKGSEQAGILARRVKFHIAADVVGMDAGIDHELDAPRSQLSNGRDGLVAPFASTGVDDESPLRADLHGHVGGIAHEHVDIALDRPHVNFTVIRVGSLAWLT